MNQVNVVKVLPPCVDIKVPYLSQLDNKNNPFGSCNVTSIAMVLRFFGIVGNGQGQLEDQLYNRIEALGWSRHSPQDLTALINRDYGKQGIRSRFSSNATHRQLKEHLATGNPAIVHGYFTDFGHIIVVKGYDDRAYGGRGAYIVHDPYGEYFESGYRRDLPGNDLKYSYRLFDELVAPDGGMWTHFITKEGKK